MAIFNLFPICDSNKAAGKSQQSILYFNLFPTILVRAVIRKRKTRSLKTEIIARSHQWCAPGFLRCFICFFYIFILPNGFTVLICVPSLRWEPFFTHLIVTFTLEEAGCEGWRARHNSHLYLLSTLSIWVCASCTMHAIWVIQLYWVSICSMKMRTNFFISRCELSLQWPFLKKKVFINSRCKCMPQT